MSQFFLPDNTFVEPNSPDSNQEFETNLQFILSQAISSLNYESRYQGENIFGHPFDQPIFPASHLPHSNSPVSQYPDPPDLSQSFSSNPYPLLEPSPPPPPNEILSFSGPGPRTMSLNPPPSESELSNLRSWIPRSAAAVRNFHIQRPDVAQNPSLPLLDQIHHIIRVMLSERGHHANLHTENIVDQHDRLGEMMISQHRRDEVARSAATGPGPAAADESGGEEEEDDNGAVTPVVTTGSGRPTRRQPTAVLNRNHPETARLMAYPRADGLQLSDHDILQMLRLPPMERHIRATSIYTERGEFYTVHRRLTEMSDVRLRLEGIPRAWVAPTLSDRPSNSVEREQRFLALGLTGDHKLTADAAAERLRRAGQGGSNRR